MAYLGFQKGEPYFPIFAMVKKQNFCQIGHGPNNDPLNTQLDADVAIIHYNNPTVITMKTAFSSGLVFQKIICLSKFITDVAVEDNQCIVYEMSVCRYQFLNEQSWYFGKDLSVNIC